MKKLVFATAIAIGGLASASTTTPIFHDGIMEVIMIQDFTEISIEELPAPVTAALAKDHPGATIDKAYVNEQAQYKLEVTMEDGSSMELIADADGNWL